MKPFAVDVSNMSDIDVASDIGYMFILPFDDCVSDTLGNGNGYGYGNGYG